MRKALLLVPLAVLLAGCTWFAPSNEADVSNQSGTDDPNVTTQNTPGETDQSGIELRRPDLGFTLRYPDSLTLDERTTCFEGCPPGATAPNFGFQAAGTDVVSLSAYVDQAQALMHFGTSEESVASYVESGQVTEVLVQDVADGTIFSFVRRGIPASAEPSIYGTEGTPDQIMSVLVANNGRVYAFDAADSADALIVESLLGSLELI
jgi:hypothetical protein